MRIKDRYCVAYLIYQPDDENPETVGFTKEVKLGQQPVEFSLVDSGGKVQRGQLSLRMANMDAHGWRDASLAEVLKWDRGLWASVGFSVLEPQTWKGDDVLGVGDRISFPNYPNYSLVHVHLKRESSQ